MLSASDLDNLILEVLANLPYTHFRHVDVFLIDPDLLRPENSDRIGKVRVHETADRIADPVERAGLPAVESLVQMLQEKFARDQYVAILALLLEPL